MVLQLAADSGKGRGTQDGFPRVLRTGHWEAPGQSWVTHTEKLRYLRGVNYVFAISMCSLWNFSVELICIVREARFA